MVYRADPLHLMWKGCITSNKHAVASAARTTAFVDAGGFLMLHSQITSIENRFNKINMNLVSFLKDNNFLF